MGTENVLHLSGGGRGRPLRVQAITDLAYVAGKVIVAGLSNEEFASNLRSIRFPFTEADAGTSVEIYHGNHGQWETRAPVRSFVPFEIKTEPHLLAAYTCTPLVTFPLADLMKSGTKVVGTTMKVRADSAPGEWNRFLITLQGDRLSVVLNEQTVVDQAQVPQLPEQGPLALVGQGAPLRFANLDMKELP